MVNRAASRLATALFLTINSVSSGVDACEDFTCSGTTICDDGTCVAPSSCPATGIELDTDTGIIQIRGWRCLVTMEDIRVAHPTAVTKEGTEYTLNNKIVVRDGCILEIHGASQASSPDAAVSLLNLKVRSCARAVSCDQMPPVKDVNVFYSRVVC